MDRLFELIEQKQSDIKAEVTVSYLEIYNETIRDLLVDEGDGPPAPSTGLALRKDGNSRISVVNLQQKTPEDPAEIQDWIDKGNRRRRTEKTNANSTSSRSHAVLQINVKVMPRSNGVEGSGTSATLSIIDLAGSERAAATSNLGARMKEGSAINKSLLALGNCINALCQRSAAGRNHIPYRDSKLTRLLEFSLGGNCKTVMIVCVSPCSVHYEDTQNTLKYANRAKQIKTVVSRNAYSVNTHVKQYMVKIAELTATVSELQSKLAVMSSQSGEAERRKAVEAKSEVERALSDVATKVQTTKNTIIDGAICQAIFFAAESRLRPIRARIAEIDRSGTALSAALIAEREVLKKIGRADEDLVHSSALQDRIATAERSTNMFDMVIRMINERRLDKLDEVAIGAVKAIAAQSNLEMELARTRAREDKLRELASCQADRLAGFAKIFAKTMVVMKEVKTRLDTAGGTVESDSASAAFEVDEAGKALAAVAQANGHLFDGLLLPSKAESSTQAAPSSMAAPSNYHPTSLALAAGPPVLGSPPRMSAPPAAALSFAPPPTFALPPKSAPVPHPLSQPPVRANASFSQPPLSPARRPLKHHAGFSSGGPSSPSRAHRSPMKKLKPSGLSAGGPKKTFRWKDEAGEGSIDDAKRLSSASPAASEEDAEWEDDKVEEGGDAVGSMPLFPSKAVAPNLFSAAAPPAPPVASGSRPLMLPKTTDFSSTTTYKPSSLSSSTSSRPMSKLSSLPESATSNPSPPTRRPLGETTSNRLSSIPSSSTSTFSTKPFSLFADGPALPSSLTRSTTASRGRESLSLGGGRTVSSPSKRRTSFAPGVGPVRSERKRGRTSLIPVPSPTTTLILAGAGAPSSGSDSSPTTTATGPRASITTSMGSGLGSGARRLLDRPGSPSKPTKPLPPPARMSLAGGPPVRSGGGPGPTRMSLAASGTGSGGLPGFMQTTAARVAKETARAG